jgi:CheY-like chemotaxis protein
MGSGDGRRLGTAEVFEDGPGCFSFGQHCQDAERAAAGAAYKHVQHEDAFHPTGRHGASARSSIRTSVSASSPSPRAYPLVVRDASMPDTDVCALVSRIRERSALSATRIVLLTSGDRPEELERCGDLPVDAELLKPVLQDELLATVRGLLEGSPSDPQAAARPPSRVPVERAQPAAAASFRVLVAEDNHFNSQLMRELLARRGHRVSIASTGPPGAPARRDRGLRPPPRRPHARARWFEAIPTIRERERSKGRAPAGRRRDGASPRCDAALLASLPFARGDGYEGATERRADTIREAR